VLEQVRHDLRDRFAALPRDDVLREHPDDVLRLRPAADRAAEVEGDGVPVDRLLVQADLRQLPGQLGDRARLRGVGLEHGEQQRDALARRAGAALHLVLELERLRAQREQPQRLIEFL
jgi:hypothetical protein